jgi:hypothetical protein
MAHSSASKKNKLEELEKATEKEERLALKLRL